MPKLLLLLLLILLNEAVYGQDLLERCDSPSQDHIFASEMEEIAIEGATPLLLFNSTGQVVGVISVTPTRAKDYPYLATSVRLNKISLCSSAQVTEFFYTKNDDHQLLTWGRDPARTIQVFQDEGMILLQAQVEIGRDHSSQITLNFWTYDVFGTESRNTTHQIIPGTGPSLKDWGSPRSQGTLHFFTPSNWRWPQK